MLVTGRDPASFDADIEFESSAEGTGSIEATLEDGTLVMRVLVKLR
jgi:hypothetical protein